jgi:hypothetical protein
MFAAPGSGRCTKTVSCALRNSLRKKYCADDVIPIYEAYYPEILGVLSATHA